MTSSPKLWINEAPLPPISNFLKFGQAPVDSNFLKFPAHSMLLHSMLRGAAQKESPPKRAQVLSKLALTAD